MEQNELEPQQPLQENPVTPGIQPPTNEAKKFPKKLAIIGVAAIAVLLIGGLTLSRTVFKQDNRSANTPKQAENFSQIEPKAIEQVFVSPVDGKKTDIKEAGYYTIAVGNTEYYGRVSKINNDYIRMLPTAYKKGSVLTFTGKELHGPEAATYFRVSKVTKFEELTDTAIIDAVKTADASVSDAFPSDDINKYVKSGQFQAYFFADGSVFFAKTTTLDGNFLASSSHVYVLRASASSGRGTETSLVLASPDQYNTRVGADVTLWQNMDPDGQITNAAAAYEKRNP